MKNIDSYTHTRGESIYLDDIPLLQGTLFGVAFGSPLAHGVIRHLDIKEAADMPGVVKVFTYQDIIGENQIGGIIPDEVLLAEHEVHFCGMPVAFIVAETEDRARAALKRIHIDIQPLHVITDPREAQEKGELIVPPRTFLLGDPDAAWPEAEYVIEGTADTNGQEHLYIETQGAYAIPQENNGIKVYSSTQSPRATQQACCKVTGLAMHEVEVDVSRLGGGFGGKEDQANAWAALCAMAVQKLKKPVKYALHRMEDMLMTGKRHPYAADFKIGLTKTFKINAYEVTFFQNAGAAADLSPAVLERTLFHCTNSYFVPNVKARAYSCRTNLPPNTAFRGFGGPQGMFVMEAAIAKAADTIGIDAAIIQKNNLLETGDEFPYGQIAVSEAKRCWEKTESIYNIDAIRQEEKLFNATNRLFKKGSALMPVCFGISFTNTMMNQARALVHVYTDGSVSVTTGAVEMGQGVNTKILQVVAEVFGINTDRIKLQSTSTHKIANTSPSAASATADLNGKATWIACHAIKQRLVEVAAELINADPVTMSFVNEQVLVQGEPAHLDWNRLVMAAFLKRVNLSEHAHYATPEIHFDKLKEKGHPFAYHVYGTAVVQVKVDCLRGTYACDAVKIVHDFGKSMNSAIDRGQVEGGVVQGIGWMTMEEIMYDKEGRLRSNSLSTYKVPDIYSVPREMLIEALKTEADNLAIFHSKAVGEPPLMYGIGAFFALRNAIKAFNPQAIIPFQSPMTPERTLLALYSKPVSQQNAYEQTDSPLAVNS